MMIYQQMVVKCHGDLSTMGRINKKHKKKNASKEVIYKGLTLRILGMSWGVKITCFEAPGVSLGGVRILRVPLFVSKFWKTEKAVPSIIYNHQLGTPKTYSPVA